MTSKTKSATSFDDFADGNINRTNKKLFISIISRLKYTVDYHGFSLWKQCWVTIYNSENVCSNEFLCDHSRVNMFQLIHVLLKMREQKNPT